jgi:glycosyltransferase involved in cell wall biosynthesis
MTPVLVVTTVHSPDDTRIRERLIRTLAEVVPVTYASRDPGPTDSSGLTWIPLPGGRLRRNFEALRIMLRRGWSGVILHDPETIPAGALTRLIRRRPVVFDVHEDLVAQIRSKSWAPWWSKPGLRILARSLYRLAEWSLDLTLAEPGYQRMFRRRHQVFPNFPRSARYPDLVETGDGSAIYLGDVTAARGVADGAAACAHAGVPLVVVGRVEEGLATELSATGDVTLSGPKPNPEALEHVARASVGLSPLRDLPNYRDSVPTKTLEYLAMGVPVVATDLPGTHSVLDGLDAVWLVPPSDIEAMSKAIEDAVRPESKDAAVAQATKVRERFRWPEDDVRSFYLGLIDRG